MPFVPPWLDVSPSLFLQAGEKGADLGEEDKRIQLEAAQMAAQSGEANQRNQLAGAQLGLSRDEQLAANALKRDELQLSVQQQQQAQQQQAAALALVQGKGTNAALTGATTAPTPKIPAAAIAYLQAHPDAAADFDAKYGEGMADTYVE